MTSSAATDLSWINFPASIAQLLIELDHLTIVACNAEAGRLYRCNLEDLLGTPILKWSPEISRSSLMQAVASPHQYSGCRRHLRPDGSSFVANVAFSVLQYQGKTLLCKFVLDVSKSAEIERLLSESEARFRAVADYTYDWESWLDENGRLVWVNPAVERFTGYCVDECFLQKDYPLSMVASEDRQSFAELLAGALQGTCGNDVEFRALHKNGSRRWFAVSWQSLKNADGTSSGIRMSMRDIADRKTMEDKLLQQKLHLEELANERAEKIVTLQRRKLHMEKLAALGVMSASVAHEINNPLAGIKNAIRLVGDRENLSESSRKLLNLVDDEFGRISKLLTQMHQLGRPHLSGRATFDLVAVLNEVVELVQVKSCSHGVNIVNQNWPKSFMVDQHEPEIRQIVFNLLINALEACTANEMIEVSLQWYQPGCFEIAVRDYGPGILPELLPTIFEPFVTTKQSSGKLKFGLGLSVSQSLANALGGGIEVQSVYGKETCFYLRLPDGSESPPSALPFE